MQQPLSEARKRLLIRLESLIGEECYNASAHNWTPDGTFLGAEERFRYPLTFRDGNGRTVKSWMVEESMPTAMLRGGHYAVGADELHIMTALERMLDYLETHHGLKIGDTPDRLEDIHQGRDR